MQLNDSEMSYFADIHALDLDCNGHIVFVGLSYEESLRLKQYHDSYLVVPEESQAPHKHRLRG